MAVLRFHAGTLEVRDVAEPAVLPEACRWDARSACHRAPASAYA
ncbi:MAG: hypothetical protein KC583_12695, partial [Myxococcales bacterium]|nr:hypothetical protein [Myxococcales bacterium]